MNQQFQAEITSFNELFNSMQSELGRVIVGNKEIVSFTVASLVAGAFLIFSVLGSDKLTVDISQVRNPLYVVLSDGSIQNSYHFKFYNMTSRPASFELSVSGLKNGKIDIGKLKFVELRAERGLRISVRVRQPVTDVIPNTNQSIKFKLTPVKGEFEEAIITPSQFITP